MTQLKLFNMIKHFWARMSFYVKNILYLDIDLVNIEHICS